MANSKKTAKAALPPVKNPDPIDPMMIPAWQTMLKGVGKFETIIEERLTYILKTIHLTFGSKLDYWYFDGAEEGQLGDLARHFDTSSIGSLIVSPSLKGDPTILLNDGSEWGLEESIPTRWLFEAFEEELKEGLVKYLAAEEQKKLLKLEKQQKREEKKRAVLDKLSPEERKVLGLK